MKKISINRKMPHVNLFPRSIKAFEKAKRNFPYSGLLTELSQLNPLYLNHYYESHFESLCERVNSKEKLKVFIENWIPNPGSNQIIPRDDCIAVLNTIIRDGRGNFPGCLIVENTRNLYQLFQLVTIKTILREFSKLKSSNVLYMKRTPPMKRGSS